VSFASYIAVNLIQIIASVLLLVVIERHVLQYASNFYIYSANDLCL